MIHILDLDFLHLEKAVAAFVVEGPSGLIMIECGPYSTWAQLEAGLQARGWSVEDIGHVFLSHIHFDHAGAAWALAERGARIYVHPRGLPHLAAPEKLYRSASQIYGDQMERLWGEMRPIPADRLTAPAHGETIEAAGLQLTAWHTPGHAVHHIAWEMASPGGQTVIFTGDVAGVCIENGPVVPPCPPPDINVEDWMASIGLLRDRPADTLYLTHFGRVEAKQAHLDQLEWRLRDWADWIRPYAEQQRPAEAVVPAFQQFVHQQLAEAGCSPEVQKRYEAANPAFMSVAGLLRYWTKKLDSAH